MIDVPISCWFLRTSRMVKVIFGLAVLRARNSVTDMEHGERNMIMHTHIP